MLSLKFDDSGYVVIGLDISEQMGIFIFIKTVYSSASLSFQLWQLSKVCGKIGCEKLIP